MTKKHDYHRMLGQCEKNSEITAEFVDRFLVPYAVERENLDREFLGAASRYRDVIRKMPEGWAGYSMTQYACLKLFKRGGLAAKYVNHSALKTRSAEEIGFLKFQIDHPWRFSFFRAERSPEAFFFELTDVFTGEVFTVYSKGIDSILKTSGPLSMLLLLIGFNGLCWQTYGTIAYFRGLQPMDIFSFSTLLNGSIERLEEVPEYIEDNPIHFMVLYYGAELPAMISRGHPVVHCKSEVKKIDLDPEKLSDAALVRKVQHIYKITLPDSEDFPHYGVCYYHSKKRHLVVTAMTEWAYAKMAELLGENGISVPGRPRIFATPVMMSLLTKDLKMKIDYTSPYAKTFAGPEPSDEEKAHLNKLNAVMRDIMDAFNAKRPVDAADLARRHGVEMETVEQIIESAENAFRNIPGRE
ncbi:MAG TPA: hypothetical protein VLM75_01770 [Spirochaetota bacterium]|nr:hypothetical protein [Spirochaetota bacterium]